MLFETNGFQTWKFHEPGIFEKVFDSQPMVTSFLFCQVKDIFERKSQQGTRLA